MDIKGLVATTSCWHQNSVDPATKITGYAAYDPDDPNNIVNPDNLLHKNYFHVSEVKDLMNEDYLKAMLFEESGDITIESNLAQDWHYASWEVKNEQLQIDFLWMEDTELTIHSLTEAEFHLTLEHLIDHKWVDDDGFDHRRLTLRIEEWELKR